MERLWTLSKQIVREAIGDRITAEAARAAYYFFLSLFPLLLALFALTGIFGGDRAFEWIAGRLRLALPGEAARYLEQFVREVTGESRPGVLSFSILFTLWSASNVFVAITEGLNRMYDVEESRSWWVRKAVAVVAVVAASVLLIGSSVALLAGPEIFSWLGIGAVWKVLRWPAALVLLVLLLSLVFFLLPDRPMRRQAVRPVVIGATTGTLLWLAGTAGFRFYVSNFGSYGETYGVIGGIIVLLLWLYLTAATILFGGEVAATLEQSWDDEWAVGEAPPEEVGCDGGG